jgi:putative solute:sodium symporter small subunit
MSNTPSDLSSSTPPLLSQEAFASRVKRLRWILLLIWGSVTFCAAFFAREFHFTWLDRPFGFWLAAQGTVLVFLAITWVYALLVNRWERQTQS